MEKEDTSNNLEEIEEPKLVPVKEILDLFEEEYMFHIKNYDLMDRFRRRIEYLQHESK